MEQFSKKLYKQKHNLILLSAFFILTHDMGSYLIFFYGWMELHYLSYEV